MSDFGTRRMTAWLKEERALVLPFGALDQRARRLWASIAGSPRAHPFRRYEMRDDLKNLNRAALRSAREMRSLIAVEAVRSASGRAAAVIFAILPLLLNSATAEPVLDA